MTVRSYYQPLRTHILATEDTLDDVARDLVEHGLHDAMCSSDSEEQLEEIKSSFEPVPGSRGVLVFEDCTATCGEDVNDHWLDGEALKMLDHALDCSYFEMCDVEGDGGLPRAVGVEKVKGSSKPAVRFGEMRNPFERYGGEGLSNGCIAGVRVGQLCRGGGLDVNAMAQIAATSLRDELDLADDTVLVVTVSVEVARETR